MRRCIGCMTSKPKNELTRIVAYEGEIRVDHSGKAKGRGAYVCPQAECIKKAAKNKGLQRSFRMSITEEAWQRVFEELSANEENA